MRKLILLFCLFIFSSTSLAQDERIYSLRQPTEDEYLSALPLVWGNAYTSSRFAMGNHQQFFIDYLISSELLYRYPELVSSDKYLTFEAYAAFFDNDFGQILSWYQWWHGNFINFDQTANHRNLAEWNRNLMEFWLNQSQIDLDNYSGRSLQYFDIDTGQTFPNTSDEIFSVTPVDFDSDGQNEWLLQGKFDTYLFVQRIGETYIVSTPALLWYDNYNTYINIAVYYWTLAIEDINDDGILDWIIHESIAMRDRGHVDRLIIYTLGDNQLTWIFASYELNPIREIINWRETDEWAFQNIDEDNALEILIGDVIYDWNGNQYLDTRQLPTVTPSPFIVPSPDSSIVLSSMEHWWAGKWAFESGDYQGALEHFDSIILGHELLCLSSPQNTLNDIDLLYDDLCLHYWRGLTLEALGQDEEALQEYIYVLDGSLSRVDWRAEEIGVESILPEYMWYYLASLHLIIDPPIELPRMSRG